MNLLDSIDKYLNEKKKKPMKKSKCCNGKVVFNNATGDHVCSVCRNPVGKSGSYMSEAYKVAQNPSDKLWYVLGDITGGGKTYYMPVSHGYKSKKEAEKKAKIQPKIDVDAKKLVSGV